MLTHFTHLHEHSTETLHRLVDEAIAQKRSPRTDRPLAGKSVAYCFMNPSLRTRVSFEVATAELGAHPVVLQIGADTWKMEVKDGAFMDGGSAEHVREGVPVLARYCHAIGLRSFPEGKSWVEDKQEPFLTAFRRHTRVPIINMESATGHPCQALADLMTIKERMEPRGKNFLLTWLPHLKALPMAVPSSAAEIAAVGGMNVTILRPEGYDLPIEVLDRVRQNCSAAGTKLTITDNVKKAFQGQHVVYGKSWGSLEAWGQPPPQDPVFRARWMVNEQKMKDTDNAIFMHCLPVRRNLKVSDEVLDGPRSVVIPQAENRLHTSKAVLLWLLSQASS